MKEKNEEKKEILKKYTGKGGPLAAGKKAVGAVSSAISAVTSFPEKLRQGRYNRTVKVVKEARKYDNAPNFDDSGNVTDAFKVRSVRNGMVDDYMKRVKKGQN